MDSRLLNQEMSPPDEVVGALGAVAVLAPELAAAAGVVGARAAAWKPPRTT